MGAFLSVFFGSRRAQLANCACLVVMAASATGCASSSPPGTGGSQPFEWADAGSGSPDSGGTCVPKCAGKTCGDNGCGGSCGTCPSTAPLCVAGACKSTCTPQCAGKECGDDGCGAPCGVCPGAAPLCVEGKCGAPCSAKDNYCVGNTLNYCAKTGAMASQTCSNAACMAEGFLGLSQCGANPGDDATCLCVGCKEADSKCSSASTAQVCDLVTGKVSAQACPTGKVCASGACVTPCANECSADACVNGKVVACVKGTDGCQKKLAPKACDDGLVCKAGGSGCAACASQADCAEDDVCTVLQSCTWAGGETYDITILSAVFPEKDGNAAWDAMGGLPDPKVCVYEEDKVLGCTPTKSDTLAATFNHTVSAELSGFGKLCFRAFDVDAISDDQADGACWPNWPALVKKGGYSGYLYSEVVWLEVTIVPSF